MKSTPGFSECDYKVIDYIVSSVKGYLGRGKNPNNGRNTNWFTMSEPLYVTFLEIFK